MWVQDAQTARPGIPDPVEGTTFDTRQCQARYRRLAGGARQADLGGRQSRARDATMAPRLRDAGGGMRTSEINGLADPSTRFWQNEPNFI
jgi:hypothetical protein